VLAQDVQAALPEVVYNILGGRYLGVSYSELVPVLIEAVKELDLRTLRQGQMLGQMQQIQQAQAQSRRPDAGGGNAGAEEAHTEAQTEAHTETETKTEEAQAVKAAYAYANSSSQEPRCKNVGVGRACELRSALLALARRIAELESGNELLRQQLRSLSMTV
jgi:hypothetical protein